MFQVIGNYGPSPIARKKVIVSYVKGKTEDVRKAVCIFLEHLTTITCSLFVLKKQIWDLGEEGNALYSSMTVKSLKKVLKSRGLSTKGSKNGLVE